MKIILASASQRRIELLQRITSTFEVMPSDFDEEAVQFNGDVTQYVKSISMGKALAVAKELENENLIISCDTIVVLNDTVLGKPKNSDDAIRMLTELSGNTHYVYSAITLYNNLSKVMLQDYVRTKVTFSNITKDEIISYVESKEPMDKAGAYGIQGNGALFVENIEGCYYSVVGLPLNRLKKMLREMGVNS